jgi:hypothetical protein
MTFEGQKSSSKNYFSHDDNWQHNIIVHAEGLWPYMATGQLLGGGWGGVPGWGVGWGSVVGLVKIVNTIFNVLLIYGEHQLQLPIWLLQ